MSAKRGLSAVSAKSGSATFAQTLARIHGIDDGGGKDITKVEILRCTLSRSTCAVRNASVTQSVKIHGQAVENTLSNVENLIFEFFRHDR